MRECAAAAASTATKWMILLLLAQRTASQVYIGASASGRVLVNVKEYMSFRSQDRQNMWTRVDYMTSERTCQEAGGVLVADQSSVAHAKIEEHLSRNGVHSLAFLGGDASAGVEGNGYERDNCKRMNGSLQDCIYRWNKGLFKTALGGNMGVPFWRGSNTSARKVGGVSLNGYPSYWGEAYTIRGELYMVALYGSNKHSYWHDSKREAERRVAEGLLSHDIGDNYVVLCEVHSGLTVDGIDPSKSSTPQPTTTTTSTPPRSTVVATDVVNTSTVNKEQLYKGELYTEIENPYTVLEYNQETDVNQSSDIAALSRGEGKDWYIIFVAACLIAAIILIIIVAAYARRISSKDAFRPIAPMTIREGGGLIATAAQRETQLPTSCATSNFDTTSLMDHMCGYFLCDEEW